MTQFHSSAYICLGFPTYTKEIAFYPIVYTCLLFCSLTDHIFLLSTVMKEAQRGLVACYDHTASHLQ